MSETKRAIQRIREEMTSERKAYIKLHIGIAGDFPDGAFYGYMDEKGIDVFELAAVAQKDKDDVS